MKKILLTVIVVLMFTGIVSAKTKVIDKMPIRWGGHVKILSQETVGTTHYKILCIDGLEYIEARVPSGVSLVQVFSMSRPSAKRCI